MTAAIDAGFTRFRPVLMTALAMIIGMLPMALSAEQNAPLGRAVIGGLIFSTVATLFFVPAVFRLVHARKPGRSNQPPQASIEAERDMNDELRRRLEGTAKSDYAGEGRARARLALAAAAAVRRPGRRRRGATTKRNSRSGPTIRRSRRSRSISPSAAARSSELVLPGDVEAFYSAVDPWAGRAATCTTGSRISAPT